VRSLGKHGMRVEGEEANMVQFLGWTLVKAAPYAPYVSYARFLMKPLELQ